MITLAQIRAARAMLGLKQQELALKAGISTGTLNNIERGVQTDPKISTMRAIQMALEAEGIEFFEQEKGEYGIRLKNVRKLSNSPTILIIDDSNTDRKLYKSWLTQQPGKKYKIIEASNAKEGYEAFLEHAPDCIILDFLMYGKNGFHLLVEMKREHAKIPPIIFVTGMHTDVVEKDAKALGVQTYLNKGKLTKEKLCEAVNEALHA